MTFDFGSQDLTHDLKIKNKELEAKVKNLENRLKNVFTPVLSPKGNMSAKPLNSKKEKVLKLEPTLLLKKSKMVSIEK